MLLFQHMIWLSLVFLSVALFAVRAPLHTALVLDWDESVYFYVAQSALEHGLPYLHAFDHKGPLLYWIFALPIAVFPGSLEPLRVFTTLTLILSMGFVFQTAREIGARFSLALIAPALYGLMFVHFGGLGCSAEIFMLVPVSVGLWLFFRGERLGHTSWTVVGQGFAFGFAFFFLLK